MIDITDVLLGANQAQKKELVEKRVPSGFVIGSPDQIEFDGKQYWLVIDTLTERIYALRDHELYNVDQREAERHLSIPLQLRMRRHRMYLSQKQFSELIGVGIKTYQSWENGARTPAAAARIKIKRRTGIWLDPDPMEVGGRVEIDWVPETDVEEG